MKRLRWAPSQARLTRRRTFGTDSRDRLRQVGVLETAKGREEWRARPTKSRELGSEAMTTLVGP
jgi:hypothetical protein